MNTQVIETQSTAVDHAAPMWHNADAVANIQRVAKMFASSPLVPQMYQGDRGIGSCVIALNMAHRMRADPLMIMQNLYVVHGRPSWSAQFLIACFNQTGRFSPIRYRFVGTEGSDNWGCRAYTKDLETGEEVQGPLITIKLAKAEGWYDKKGSKWQTMPEMMLQYRAAAWMIRTTAPEIAMGLPTQDEQHDVGEMPQRANVRDIAAQIDNLPDPEQQDTDEIPQSTELFPDESI